MDDESTDIRIRAISYKDLDTIAKIDSKILGKDRAEYWKMKLELAKIRSPVTSLVAEKDGMVVGFILGTASGWEYGVPDTIGWIDTIGVDPKYQHQGIAKLLMDEMINNMQKVGVKTIYTLVNWREGSLLQFFDKMGFNRGDMLNLELNL